MYCPSCEEERLGSWSTCAACGGVLKERERAEVEAELTHVRYLLGQVRRWEPHRVPRPTQAYLEERYRRVERILVAALGPAEGAGLAPEESGQPESPPEPVVMALPVAEAAPVPSAPASAPPEEPVVMALPVEPAVDSPPPVPELALAEPAFEVPAERSEVVKAVEEASTWRRVWKPFLYESVGWFVGAFLILAGTFYFVAESWSGMSSLLRSLVVFGLTAAYAAGFGLWGWLFSRKETLAGAGRVLGLIGAAAAPLAAIALGPVAEQHALFWPLGLGWAGVAALLARRPAQAYHPEARGPLGLLMLLVTLVMGAAPLLARGGAEMVWLGAVPVLLVMRVHRGRSETPVSREAIAFALLAPAYLLALFALRLHLALAAASVAPALGTYAPFAAALLGSALRLRAAPRERAADALEGAVVALQAACLAAAVLGQAPAFFLTSAVCAFTLWRMSRGAAGRVGWLYGVYAAAYLAYQSAGTLVPGPLLRLLAQVKHALGYAPARELPFAYDALYAMLFVLGGAVVAVRLLRPARGPEAGAERRAAAAEVLLRSTAVAGALFTVLSMTVVPMDQRPALGTVPVVVVALTALGLWLDRSYLTWTGAMASLLVPVFAGPLMGHVGAGLVTACLALGFAVLSTFVAAARKAHRGGLDLAAVLLSVMAAAFAWVPPFRMAGSLTLGVTSAAVALLAWRREGDGLRMWAAALLASAAPLFFLASSWPYLAPVSLAVASLLLAVASDRLEPLDALRSLVPWGSTLAAVWQLLLQVEAVAEVPVLLGPVLVLGTLGMMLCARRAPAMAVLGAPFLGLALLPPLGDVVAWPGLSPLLSAILYALLALGASAWTALRGRSAATVAYAVASQLGAAAAALLAVFHPAGETPVYLACALGALLSTRALHPAFSITWATAWALAALVRHGGVPLLLLPVSLTVLALADELPAPRRALFGERPLGRVASLCALATALVVCRELKEAMLPWLAALAVVLPLAWVRATRLPFFAAAPAAMVLVLTAAHPGHERLLWVLPALAVALTRLVRGVPVVGRGLLGDALEARGEALRKWLLGSVVAAGPLALAASQAAEVQVGAMAFSLLLSASEPLSWRLVAAGGLAALVPEARPWMGGALLAVGFAAHHAPALTHRLLGADEDRHSRPVAALTALGLAALPCLLPLSSGRPFLIAAGVVLLCTLLLSERWLLAAVPALVGLGLMPWRGEPSLAGAGVGLAEAFAWPALGAAVAAAVCRAAGVQAWLERASRRVSPGVPGAWSEPLWAGAAAVAVGSGLLWQVGVAAHPFQPLGMVVLGAAALALLITPVPWQAAVASGLLGWVAWQSLPPAWAPVGVASVGVSLCYAGALLRGRFQAGLALHHAGWGLAVLALAGLTRLDHPAMPLCMALVAACAWGAVLVSPSLEAVGWASSAAALHALLVYVGVAYSTGKPEVFIFPYFAAASALTAGVVLLLPERGPRRAVGQTLAGLALVEAMCGLAWIDGQALPEAWVCGAGLAVLCMALVRSAARREDELSAYLAQGCLVLGYLVLRWHGLGARELSGADSLAALVAGVLFSGLSVWARRESASEALARPARVGAFLLPLVGLLAAPWSSEPLVSAALLVGHAAHFAAMATAPSQRRVASILAAAAFNAALVFTWLGTGGAEPQYFLIPAGLSVLVLVRVFRADLAPLTEARLRAAAITAIYAASAWRPLMFQESWAMLACVGVCVVGVAAGIALRIRSYVYLGTGFLVTTVAANLVHYGVRDHRLGAAFLSALGLLVVGFMVLLSAQREEVLRRYRRMRALLEEWQE